MAICDPYVQNLLSHFDLQISALIFLPKENFNLCSDSRLYLDKMLTLSLGDSLLNEKILVHYVNIGK